MIAPAPSIRPGFLRPENAAQFLGISARCLRDWTRRGIVAHVKPCRKVTLYGVADLERAMERFRCQAVGD
jgi:predicted site-specific integrase-resolvase